MEKKKNMRFKSVGFLFKNAIFGFSTGQNIPQTWLRPVSKTAQVGLVFVFSVELNVARTESFVRNS